MTRRRLLFPILGAVLSALLVVGVSVTVGGRAGADEGSRCERFGAAAKERTALVTGAETAQRILVIGDSYSVGLGVGPDQSWPTRLPGRVSVAGFSGSGFSSTASPCGPVSFAARARAALNRAGPVDLVIVEGGLNDYDRPAAEIEAGFERLMDVLAGRRVLVVGPPDAPARRAAVPAVDGLLGRLCAERGIGYVRTSGHRFTYLDDGLHLTPEGHRSFADLVTGGL